MEISVIALEELILENEYYVKNSKQQLAKIQSGTMNVSSLKLASIENKLEEASLNVEKYKKILDAIPKEEQEKQRNLISVQEALKKQSYYKLQKIRIKKNLNLKRTQKLEAMMIIDELPHDVNFDDKELIEVSDMIIKNNIREVIDIDKKLSDIKNAFNSQKEKLKDEKDLKYFALLDTYIPIIILHFSYLIEDINKCILEHNEDKNDENKLIFRGLPKFDDWWIEELFINHQAYFGLYKWKNIISKQCITEQHKIIWEKIFNNWLMIKKILNSKEENAFDYNYIFDDLIRTYVGLEEELDNNNLEAMEKIVNNIILKEDFTKMKSTHSINTVYLQWKTVKVKNKKS
jgi:hypothetical protein